MSLFFLLMGCLALCMALANMRAAILALLKYVKLGQLLPVERSSIHNDQWRLSRQMELLVFALGTLEFGLNLALVYLCYLQINLIPAG